MDKIKQLAGKLYRYGYSSLIAPLRRRADKKSFWNNYRELKSLYLTEKDNYDFLAYVMPEWRDNMHAIENYFLNNLSFGFLNHPVIKNTMFMYTFRPWRNIQKKLIADKLSKTGAKNILREYDLGKPLLNDFEYVSSGNNIHHLYHLLKFFQETGTNAIDFKTIVEVGGGYGNMAKIAKALNKNVTYTIIDLPIFSYLQTLYLRTLFGREAVNLIGRDNLTIKPGTINIVPLDQNTITALAPMLSPTDLFLSTWALSESNRAMQELIKGFGYFGAKYLLLAYQRSNSSFAHAEEIGEIDAGYEKLYNKETAYTKDNYYLFCRHR